MYCSHCGVEVPEGDRYCGSCGAPLAAAGAGPSGYTGFSRPEPTRYGDLAGGEERAGFGLRFGGYIIDPVLGFIAGFVLSIMLYLVLLPDPYTQEELDNAQLAATIIVVVAYYTYKWIADSMGGTVGKLIVGIRVVDETSLQPTGLGNGFVRTFVSFFSGLPLGLGFLWAAWDKDGKTWHDKAASTIVIKRR
jgi:uncharacterized RDD family membrane protein YckC